MAGRRGRSNGGGFSLMELAPTLQEVAATLIDALDAQGVTANPDMIFRGVQDLVSACAANTGFGMTASDKTPKPAYNFSADYLAVASEFYNNGKKQEAVRHALLAFEQKDSSTLFDALLIMNSNSDAGLKIQAEAEEEGTDFPTDDEVDNGEETEGKGSEEEEGDDEISDEEIDEIIKEQENAAEKENEGGGDGSSEEEGSGEEEENGGEDNDSPMTGTREVSASTADAHRRIMAIKMSANGSVEDRNRAHRVLKR